MIPSASASISRRRWVSRLRLSTSARFSACSRCALVKVWPFFPDLLVEDGDGFDDLACFAVGAALSLGAWDTVGDFEVVAFLGPEDPEWRRDRVGKLDNFVSFADLSWMLKRNLLTRASVKSPLKMTPLGNLPPAIDWCTYATILVESSGSAPKTSDIFKVVWN